MKRYGVALFLATFATLTLTGCRPKPEKAGGGKVGLSEDIPRIVFSTNVTPQQSVAHLHSLVRKKQLGIFLGTVVVWRGPNEFDVVFNEKQNPCEVVGSIHSAGTYAYRAVSNGTKYKFECKVGTTPTAGTGPFPYNIIAVDRTKPQPTYNLPDIGNNHCEGCVIEVDED